MNQGPDQSPAPTPGGVPPATGTSTGLDPNLSGALTYILGVFTGILFLLIEKKSSFVRFHAAQSIGIFVVFVSIGIIMSVLSMVLGAIPVIGILAGIVFFLISLVFGFGGFILWIYLMYQAYQGNEWEFPFVGAQVRQMLRR